MSDKKKDKIKEIRQNLLASDDILIKEGLKKAKKHGDESLIHPLLTALLNTEGSLRNDISETLSSLKISNAEDELISALTIDDYSSLQSEILSFIWNSGFQPSEHLLLITKTAVEGDYNTALEALTLIESMDCRFPEEQIMESTLEIRSGLNDEDDDDKKKLILSLLQVIERLPVE